MTDRTLFQVDGWNVADAGVMVNSDSSGWRDAPELAYQVAPRPGRRDSTVLNPEPPAAARRLVVVGTMAAESMAELRELEDVLKLKLQARPPLELAFGDVPTLDRVHFGVLERCELKPIRPAFAQPANTVSITLLCTDPLKYDAAETVVNFTAAPTAAPTGTAVCYPVITIHGPVLNPAITYRDAEGAELVRMEFTVALAAGEHLVVDCGELVITDEAGAELPETLTDAPDFVAIDPADAFGLQGPFPTLEISPTPALAEARYRRAWS